MSYELELWKKLEHLQFGMNQSSIEDFQVEDEMNKKCDCDKCNSPGPGCASDY